MRALVFAVFIVLAPGTCFALCPDAPPRPVVKVAVQEQALDFVADKTRRDLSARALGMPEASPAKQGAFAGGMAEGAIRLYHDVVFERATDKESGAACLWISEVRVRVTVDPVMHIAQDLQQSDCWYQEIYRHELKHVDADRQLLQKYAGRITDGLRLVFATPADYVSGPFPASRAEGWRVKMHDGLAPPLGALFTMMMQERAEVQRAVDTPAEYARVAEICRGERIPGES